MACKRRTVEGYWVPLTQDNQRKSPPMLIWNRMRWQHWGALRKGTKRAFSGPRGADSVGEGPSCAAEGGSRTSWVSTPGWGGGGPGEKPPPAAFSQGRCKPPRASAAGALRSPVQEEKIPFQKARLSTQIKVKLFNKSSPRSHVGEIYFCIIALSRDLEAIFFFAVNLLGIPSTIWEQTGISSYVNYLTIPRGNSFSICFPIANIISAGSIGNSRRNSWRLLQSWC